MMVKKFHWWAIVLVLAMSIQMIVAQPAKIHPAFLNQGHAWADSVLATLSLDEKIGQLIMVDAFTRSDISNTEQVLGYIQKYHIGGVIFFAGSPNVQIYHTNRFQNASKIPLLIAIDAENGAGNRLDSAVHYPFNMTLGAVQSKELLRKWGNTIGLELKSLGVHINLAPVVDINNNPDNPIISWRAFSDDPQHVAEYGLEVMKGMEEVGIMATAKHFPGHGDTDVDSHLDLPVLPFTKQRLDSIELVPFRHLIDAGISSVMTAHMEIPTIEQTANVPSTLSKKFTTDILKKELGFEGLIITDALNMKGVTKNHDQATIGKMALLAGNDLLLYPEDIEAMIAGIKSAIKEKTIPLLLIDEKCKKVLLAKYWAGLSVDDNKLVKQKWRKTASQELMNRQLIENAITVLRNENELIPLQNLENLNPISISIGADKQTIFQNRLGDYMPMQHIHISHKATKNELVDVEKAVADKNLIIIGMHKDQAYPWSNDFYTEDIYQWIKSLANGKQVIVAHFRNPFIIPKYADGNIKTILTTYQDDDIAQDYAAQVIFGGISAKGKIPVAIDGYWARNSGLETKGETRFKYTLPEELGINGESLDFRISAVMNQAIIEKAFPGGQVFLAKDRKVFYHKSFGQHTYEGNRAIVNDDIYDLASITKVTATTPALMKLHDQNQLNLDAPLKHYFPYLKHSNKKNIPLRPILAHQAGLKPWIPFYKTTTRKNGKFKSKTLSATPSIKFSGKLSDSLFLHQDYKKKIFKMIKKSKIKSGSGYLYSDLPFYLFYEFVDRTAPMGMLQFLDSEFYKPLGAGTLTYNPLHKFSKERIVPTENDNYFRMQLLHGVVHDEGAAMLKGVSGHAGLFGTANDLAKMWQMYLDNGEYGGKRYLSAQTVQKFTLCQYCEQGNKRALAFDKPDLVYHPQNSSTAKAASMRTFGHSGFTGTLVWADPEYDLLYIFLSNRVYPTRESRKIYTLNIRPTVHNIVYEEMLRGKKDI